MNDCVIRSLCYLTDDSPEELKKWFEWGKEQMPDGSPKPPGIHKVIDYLMTVGIALTPISKEPTSYHGRAMYKDFTDKEAAERWEIYTNNYEGLLMGVRRGIGHMTYLDHGTVRDRRLTYDISECAFHLFTPDTFMVATWQV